MAIAHKLLVAAYEILRRRIPFVDLGDYLDRRSPRDTTRKLARRRVAGFDVNLTAREGAYRFLARADGIR